MSSEIAKCALCGEPMPDGEQMFKFHGYSGPCQKPPLPGRADVTGVPKVEMTVLERECLKLLCEVQMHDGENYFRVPHEMRLRIDAVLLMASQRRLGA